MCDELSFINAMQKTLKNFQTKCFNSQDGGEKTSYLGIQLKGIRRIRNLADAFFKYL